MKHGVVPFCLLLFSLFFFENLHTFAQPAFTFQGDYLYMPNHPYRDIFDLTPDGKYGVTLTSVISPNSGGQITSFDPVTGTRIDTKFVGFGPATMKLVKLNEGVRVVVLTTQGGPRKITIYDLDANGFLTFRAATQITTSGSDIDSNIVLSATGRVGFTRSTNDVSNQIVSFSLDDGSVLNRINTVSSSRLTMYEDANRRIIVSGSGGHIVFIDAANPSQMVSLGQVVFSNFSGELLPTLFSKDGQYLFVAGGPSTLSAIDTNTRQVVGELTSSALALSQIKIFDDGSSRLLIMRLAGPQNGLILIDASNPANLTIANQVNFGPEIFGLSDFTFSQNGKRLFFADTTKIIAFSIPDLATVWETPLRSTQIALSITTFSQPERILAAYASNNNFAATIFSFPNRTNRLSNFDLDGKTDISVFRSSTGFWYWLNSTDNHFNGFHFGQADDVLVPADYDGDDKTDIAIWRPSDGAWYIYQSLTNTVRITQFGLPSDKVVPTDYDGDGKTDIALFRRNPNRWFILRSSDENQMIQKFSTGTGTPVTGDFDGDGKADLTFFNSTGQWQILKSSDQIKIYPQFGLSTDIPVAGDYDNDGITDLAVFRPSDRTWYILQSFAGFRASVFGLNTDKVVQADYDGDGKTDIAVFRPSTATWYILRSSDGGVNITQFGLSTDLPGVVSY